jgi:hypothetical protein
VAATGITELRAFSVEFFWSEALFAERFRPLSDHRQDSKGTWWMPWHLESMKGVDGCEKPR